MYPNSTLTSSNDKPRYRQWETSDTVIGVFFSISLFLLACWGLRIIKQAVVNFNARKKELIRGKSTVTVRQREVAVQVDFLDPEIFIGAGASSQSISVLLDKNQEQWHLAPEIQDGDHGSEN